MNELNGWPRSASIGENDGLRRRLRGQLAVRLAPLAVTAANSESARCDLSRQVVEAAGQTASAVGRAVRDAPAPSRIRLASWGLSPRRSGSTLALSLQRAWQKIGRPGTDTSSCCLVALSIRARIPPEALRRPTHQLPVAHHCRTFAVLPERWSPYRQRITCL